MPAQVRSAPINREFCSFYFKTDRWLIFRNKGQNFRVCQTDGGEFNSGGNTDERKYSTSSKTKKKEKNRNKKQRKKKKCEKSKFRHTSVGYWVKNNRGEHLKRMYIVASCTGERSDSWNIKRKSVAKFVLGGTRQRNGIMNSADRTRWFSPLYSSLSCDSKQSRFSEQITLKNPIADGQEK